MYKALKFVAGAVAKKDFVPAMTHFVIENSIVRSWNGNLALCSPIDFGVNCKPKAKTLVQAIAKCEDDEQIVLSMTPAGRLRVKGGTFTALIECVEGDTNHAVPSGNFVEMNGQGILDAFKALAPFVGDDATRPWANGILLRGDSAYATCNVMLAQYWVGVNFPIELNIPMSAVAEVIRIGEPPERFQCDEKSVTFHYSDERWIRTNLYSTEWPDIDRVLNRASNATPINEEIFTALGKLKPFTDKANRIYFKDGKAVTHATEDGAAYEPKENPFEFEGVYNLQILERLQGVVKTIDLSTYPEPCMFFGDKLRGAVIGMKQ